MTNRLGKQAIFDRVATHLLTQMKQSKTINSKGNSVCMYLNPEGLKCAVGCLVNKDLAKKLDESMGEYNSTGVSDYHIETQLPYAIKHHVKFLSELQNLHDYHNPAVWFNRLLDLAKRHNLNDACVRKFD